LCIGRAVRRGQVDEHRGATYCTLSNLDSNISTPISVNQLCDSDGNDTLSIDGENAIADVTDYLDGGRGNANLRIALRLADLFAHSINSGGQ
jgi:hypothetical protein